MHDRRKRFCSRASFFLYKYPPSNVMICPVRYSGAQISFHHFSNFFRGGEASGRISSASSARSASSNCLFISVSMTPHARALTGILLLASSLASAWSEPADTGFGSRVSRFTGCTVYAPHGGNVDDPSASV